MLHLTKLKRLRIQPDGWIAKEVFESRALQRYEQLRLEQFESLDFWKQVVLRLESIIPSINGLLVRTVFYHRFWKAIAANDGDSFTMEETLLSIATTTHGVPLEVIAFLCGYAIDQSCRPEFIDEDLNFQDDSRRKSDTLWEAAIESGKLDVLEYFTEIHPGMNILRQPRLVQLLPLIHNPETGNCSAPRLLRWFDSVGLQNSLKAMSLTTADLSTYFFTRQQGPMSIAFHPAVQEHLPLLVLDPAWRQRFAIDIHAVSERSGESLLHIAARYSHAEVVDFLLEAGLAADAVNVLGMSPLDCSLNSDQYIATTPLILASIRREAKKRGVFVERARVLQQTNGTVIPGHAEPVTAVAVANELVISGTEGLKRSNCIFSACFPPVS